MPALCVVFDLENNPLRLEGLTNSVAEATAAA
jgi:hypothetical protein